MEVVQADKIGVEILGYKDRIKELRDNFVVRLDPDMNPPTFHLPLDGHCNGEQCQLVCWFRESSGEFFCPDAPSA
jgi:hypothetical protein